MKNRMVARSAWISFALVLVLFIASAAAQDPPARFKDLPRDSVAVFSLDIDRMRQNRAFEAVPWEVLDALLFEQFGIDLATVKTIDGTVMMPSPLPEFGVSVRMTQPFDIADFDGKKFTDVEVSDKDPGVRVRDVLDWPILRCLQKEQTRLLIGTAGTLRRMTSPRLQTGGEMLDALEKNASVFQLGVNFKRLRDLVPTLIGQQTLDSLASEFREDIETGLGLVESIWIQMDPDKPNPFRLSLGTIGKAQSEELRLLLERIQQTIADDALSVYIAESEKAAIKVVGFRSVNCSLVFKEYLDRLKSLGEPRLQWVVEDNRVVWSVDTKALTNYMISAALIVGRHGFLSPVFDMQMMAMESDEQMKLILQGLMEYHRVHGQFPPQAILGADGTPLLSWRVAILPFLGEKELYDRFALDEPWDSEHNLDLLYEIPGVYEVQYDNNELTPYLIPIGDGMGLGMEGRRLADITDGATRTIALLKVHPSLAVSWTKPEDLEVIDYPGVAWMEGGGGKVASFAGTLHTLGIDLDPEIVAALMSIAGGEAEVELP